MGWNGSYSKGRAPAQKAPSGKDVRGLVLKGLVAGLIVVGCACFFLFRSGKDDAPVQEPPKKSKVTKRQPAPAASIFALCLSSIGRVIKTVFIGQLSSSFLCKSFSTYCSMVFPEMQYKVEKEMPGTHLFSRRDADGVFLSFPRV